MNDISGRVVKINGLRSFKELSDHVFRRVRHDKKNEKVEECVGIETEISEEDVQIGVVDIILQRVYCGTGKCAPSHSPGKQF